MTAPVVVASWISLQYDGLTVAAPLFGAGNTLTHNVIGGLGVVGGNGGRLRTGLPWQAVHDGTRLTHEPLRLTVMLDAPTSAINAILDRHTQVTAPLDNGCLHLLALNGDGSRRTICPVTDGAASPLDAPWSTIGRLQKAASAQNRSVTPRSGPAMVMSIRVPPSR